MKIFAICVVKNEADIIAYSLKKAMEWADKIFVVDNGSTDNSWAVIQSLANEVITPWKVLDVPFYDGIRGEVFNHFKSVANEGDWWCFRLDADEIYITNPRNFLEKVPKNYHLVYKKSIDYFLTNEDLNDYEFAREFEKNIDKIKYFSPIAWSESRFFKHRNRLVWPAGNELPNHIGLIYPEHILVKHYQYRSPEQMQVRLDVRQDLKKVNARQNRAPIFGYVTQTTWRELLKEREELIKDNGPESYQLAKCLNNSLAYSFIGYWYRRILHATGIWP